MNYFNSFLGYNGDDFMDVMVKREEAKDFLQRDRRDLNHECYAECCRWEEVREHYEFDIPAAVRLNFAYKFTINTVKTIDILENITDHALKI